jgi:hypothetical protein
MEILKQKPVVPPVPERIARSQPAPVPKASRVPLPGFRPRPPRRQIQPERINELERFMREFRRELDALENR